MAGRVVIAAVVLALGALIAVLIAADDDGGGGASTSDTTVAVLGPAPFKPNLPFAEPPVVEVGGRSTTRLAARNGTLRVSGIDVEEGQSYVPAGAAGAKAEPGLLGPTLHVNPGETLDITLDNRLEVYPGLDTHSAETCGGAQDPSHEHESGEGPDSGPQFTNLHFHGLHVTPTTRLYKGMKVYGENVLVSLPKGTSRIRFPIPTDHEEGTFWYHAHRHGCTDDQVFRGLAGLLIVGDSRKDLPARFHGVRTRSLALKDIQVEPKGNVQSIPADHDWANPTHRTVNGLVNPRLSIRPRETQLWRLANVSSAVWYQVALVDEKDKPDPFLVVALDGSTLEEAQQEDSVLLGPGQRNDILVRGPSSGTRTLKTLPFDQGRLVFPEDTLATVAVEDQPATELKSPDVLKPLPAFPSKRGIDRTFVFSFKPNGPTINFKPFDPDPNSPPIADPQLDTTETWTFVNESPDWHPIHIHQDDFKVTHVNGKQVDNYGQQDVVSLPPMSGKTPGKVVIEMPFKDFDGKFVIHCHILDHEDGGMMGRIDLAPAAPD
jgi:suppressor of ftsI